jgi:hypothetical protein
MQFSDWLLLLYKRMAKSAAMELAESLGEETRMSTSKTVDGNNDTHWLKASGESAKHSGLQA